METTKRFFRGPAFSLIGISTPTELLTLALRFSNGHGGRRVNAGGLPATCKDKQNIRDANNFTRS